MSPCTASRTGRAGFASGRRVVVGASIFLGTGIAVCSPALGQEAAAPQDIAGLVQEEHAEAVRTRTLVAGLTAFESSIMSIAWRQTVYLPPNRESGFVEWVPWDESWRYWDCAWNWAISERTLEPGAENAEASYAETLMVADGSRRLSWSVDEKHGVLTTPDEYPVGGLQLLRALGRSFDFDGAPFTAPLSTLLRDASELRYLPPSEDEPWPGLHASGFLKGYAVECEVRLDAEHGMVPRVVRTIRPQDGLVADDLRVIEVMDCGGIWLPRVCVYGGFYAQIVKNIEDPISELRRADLERALTLEGLPESLQGAAVRDAIEAAQAIRILDAGSHRVSGPFTVFEPGGDGIFCPQVMLVEAVRLNTALDIRGLFRGQDPDGQVFDGFTGEFVTLEAAQESMHESGLNLLLDPFEAAEGQGEH